MKNILAISALCAAAAMAPAQTPQILPAQPQAPQIMPAQMPQAQPSAEELQKRRQAQIDARRERLKEMFGQMRPPTEKIGETFWEKYWPYALCAAALAAIAAWALARRRRAKIRPPYETAMDRFATLQNIGAKISAKEYAQEVSQIVRDYIEAVHNIPAPERTTEEFLQIAAACDVFDAGAKESLAKILTLADIAKFARHAFSDAERAEIFGVSAAFVDDDNLKNKNRKKDGKPGNQQ